MMPVTAGVSRLSARHASSATVDVADVDLDDRAGQHLDRVEHRDRMIGKRRWIDRHPGRRFGRFVQPVDHLVFAVRLSKDQIQAMASGRRPTHRLDVRQGGAAVDLRFARA